MCQIPPLDHDELRFKKAYQKFPEARLDEAKTVQEITFAHDTFTDRVSVSKKNAADAYNMELSADEVEVENG